MPKLSRTEPGNQPQYQPRGLPKEITNHRRAHSNGRGWRHEQWKQHHETPGMTRGEAPPKAELSASIKGAATTRMRRWKDPWGAAGKSTTYGLLGQNPLWNPHWTQGEYAVPEKYLNAASPTFPNDASSRKMTAQEHAEYIFNAPPGEGAGDYTLGIRGPKPRISATYHDLGQIRNWEPPEKGMPHKHHSHSSPCFPTKALSSGTSTELGHTYKQRAGEVAVCSGPMPKSQPDPDLSPGRGNLTKGVKGPEPHFASTYSYLGRVPGFKNGSHGLPVKHQHHSVSCYPELNKSYIEAVQKATGPLGHGDHTRGIKGKAPHFTSTYMDLGKVEPRGIPNEKHYDFDDLANKNYRFTFWEAARKEAQARGNPS